MIWRYYNIEHEPGSYSLVFFVTKKLKKSLECRYKYKRIIFLENL